MDGAEEVCNEMNISFNNDQISNSICMSPVQKSPVGMSPVYTSPVHMSSHAVENSLLDSKNLPSLPSMEYVSASLEQSTPDKKSPSPLPISSPSSPCSNSSSLTCNKLKIRRIYTSESSEGEDSPQYKVIHSPISTTSSSSCSPSRFSFEHDDYPPSPCSKSTSSIPEIFEPLRDNLVEQDIVSSQSNLSSEFIDPLGKKYDRKFRNTPSSFDDYPFSRTPSPFLIRVNFESSFSHDSISTPFVNDLLAQTRDFPKMENKLETEHHTLFESSLSVLPNEALFTNDQNRAKNFRPRIEPNFSGVLCDKHIYDSTSSCPSPTSSPWHTPPKENKCKDILVDPGSISSLKSSTVELIDVDDPYVIDLTSEEMKDSEIEVVASKPPPVIFIGSEVSKCVSYKPRSRHSRLRKNLSKHQEGSQSSRDANETIVIKDGSQSEIPLNLSLGSSESYPIPIVDSPERIPIHSNASEHVNTSEIAGHGTLEFLEEQTRLSLDSRSFGDLLNNSVIPIESESSNYVDSYDLCTCSVGDCVVHPSNLPLKKRILTVSQPGAEYRCRSPINTRSMFTSVDDGIFSVDLMNEPEHTEHFLNSLMKNEFSAPSSSRIAGSSLHDHPPNVSWFGREFPGSLDKRVRDFQTRHGGNSKVSGLAVDSLKDSQPHGSKSALNSEEDKEDNSPACPICFESFQCIKEKARLLSSTSCGHIFCTECLEESLKRNKQCPTCRRKLNKKQYHPLYLP